MRALAPAAPTSTAAREWGWLGAAVLAAALLIGGYLYRDREEHHAIERDRLQVQARVVADNLARQLEGVSHALAGVRHGVGALEPGRLAQLTSPQLTLLNDALPGIRSMHVLGLDGRVVATSRDPSTLGRSFAHRELFTAPRDRPDPSLLYLSPPYVTQREGVMTVSATRAIVDAGGAFAGAVTAPLDAEYFEVMLRSVLYAPDMRVGLLHGDGVLFVYMPPSERGLGVDRSRPGSFFSRHQASGQPANVFVGTSSVNGDTRMMAMRTVEQSQTRMDPPFIVAVSRDMAAIEQPWRSEAATLGGLLLLSALVGSASLVLHQRRRRAQAEVVAATQALRRDAEQRLELALAGAELGLWDWQITTNTLTFSERWYTMLGYAAGEFEASMESWRELLHPDDGPRALAAVDAHLRGDTPLYELEHRLWHKDGGWRWILARGKVVQRGPDGTAVRMVGTHMDITARKQAEAALNDANAFTEQVIAGLPHGFAVRDAELRYRRWNPMMEQLTGLPEAALLGRTTAEALPEMAEPLRESLLAALQRALAGEIAVTGDRRIERPDGTLLWTSAIHGPLRDAAGRVIGTLSSVLDITPRKLTEQQLQRSEARFRAIFEASPEGMQIVDAQGRIIEANAAALAILEADSADELRARAVVDQLVPEHRPAFAALHQRVMAGEPGSLECEIDALKGARRWLEIHAAPLRDAAGQVTMLIAVHDVTRRKQGQAERRALQQQLWESQKMEAIGNLAGGIAHDFNNILGAILGNAALARQDIGSDHPAELSLEQITKASLRARDLVHQILAFSRRQQQDLVTQPLQPLVSEVLALLRTTLPAMVQLDCAMAVQPLYVNGDATQIEQVLMNLCTNAWHALQGSSGRIVVGLEAVEIDAATARRLDLGAPGPYAHLSVRDTGSGMDASTRARIFEPFYTTKPAGQGTGLGLSVVHGIIATHRGAVAVDSEPGRGSTFHVYLPLVAAAAPLAAAAAETPAQLGDGDGQRLLYLDDDEVMLLMVERLLQRAGYRVATFSDPVRAIAAVAAEPAAFALVVSDFSMPGQTGLDVARALAAIRPDLPVIITSGFISDDMRGQAQRLGVRRLLEKQFTIELLIGLVREVLAEPRR